jgi:hypothetical protein
MRIRRFPVAECRRALFDQVSEGAVAISGPILSIVQPCFGQTGVDCE